MEKTTRESWCPECVNDTDQKLRPYDPDDPDPIFPLYVWECMRCNESIEIIDEDGVVTR